MLINVVSPLHFFYIVRDVTPIKVGPKIGPNPNGIVMHMYFSNYMWKTSQMLHFDLKGIKIGFFKREHWFFKDCNKFKGNCQLYSSFCSQFP